MLNNQLKILAVKICLIIFLSGCATSEAQFIPAENASPKFLPDKVQILNEAPLVPYKVLGEIRAKGSSREQLEAILKKKAFEVGADALINMKITEGNEQKARGQYASSELLWEPKKNKMGVTVQMQAVATAITLERKTK